LQEPLQAMPSAGIKLPDIADDGDLWIDDNTKAFSHRIHGIPAAMSDVSRSNKGNFGNKNMLSDVLDDTNRMADDVRHNLSIPHLDSSSYHLLKC